MPWSMTSRKKRSGPKISLKTPIDCRAADSCPARRCCAISPERPPERPIRPLAWEASTSLSMRPMVEALGVADRDQLHEVVVAAFVGGQQGHVVVRLFDPRSRLVVAAPGRDVDLAAQDGLDAPVDRRVVEGHGSEHVAVVGDGERLHAELAHLVDELVDVARAVEEAVLGVEMKVDEFGG